MNLVPANPLCSCTSNEKGTGEFVRNIIVTAMKMLWLKTYVIYSHEEKERETPVIPPCLFVSKNSVLPLFHVAMRCNLTTNNIPVPLKRDTGGFVLYQRK